MKTTGYLARDVVAGNIKALLDYHSMKVMDLARKADISPSFVGRVLKEQTNISIDKLEIIGQPFGYRGWALACPAFNPRVSQKQYDSLLEAYSSPSLNDNQRGSIVAYAKFQSTQ